MSTKVGEFSHLYASAAVCLVLLLGTLASPAGADAGRKDPAPVTKVDVGYESGLAVHLLSSDDVRRIETIPRQDLFDREHGRYTLLRDDGVTGHWGMDALRARRDAASKPYAELRRGDHFQTERVIFADPSTGATLMRLTSEPDGAGDELVYFGKSAYNADGSLMVWQRSLKPSIWGPGGQETSDTHGPLLVDGDGARPRVAFRQLPSLQAQICHPTNPDLAYALSENALVELNLCTGKVQRTIAAGLPGWWLKLSPDGKYACSASYDSGRIVVAAIDTGQRWEVKLKGRIHDSYRFVPGDTDWIMYWYERGVPDHGGFHMVNFKTGEDRSLGFTFDWNHGDVGRYLGVHTDGQLLRYADGAWSEVANLTWPDAAHEDSAPYYDIPADANGYSQHWPDDQLWAYHTRIVERPYLSELFALFSKPIASGGRANRFRICTTNLMRDTDGKGEKTRVLDRPNISFDGTKLLFNSNVFGAAEVYQVILRNPRPPANVRAHWTSGGVRVTWDASAYHQEIAGYRVYRSRESGRGFELLSDQLVTSGEFVDKTVSASAASFYAVRSAEHSGLESGLSAEAAVASDRASLSRVPLRVFVEAEDAIPADLAAPSPDALWLNFEGMASDLYYIWQRRRDKPGRLQVEVNVPRAGDYYLYARMKGSEGAEFQIGSQRVHCAASDAWQWVRSSGTVRLPAGRQTIPISSAAYGSCLDCLYLATDAAFQPRGRITAAVPATLTLTADRNASGLPRLSWSGDKSPRWSHYNLYCSTTPGFTPDQRSLLASPDETQHLDWQAPRGPKYYRVTQVTRDGLESKHSNEVAME